MKSLVRLFFVFIVLSGISGSLLLVCYLSENELDFVELFKVPLIAATLVAVIFSFFHGLRLFFFEVILILFALVAMGNGIFDVNFQLSTFLVHSFIFLMPVVAISFGYETSANGRTIAEDNLPFLMTGVCIISGINLIIYLVSYHFFKTISYFGFYTDLALVAAYAISKRKMGWFCTIILLLLLSGKRSVLLGAIAPAVVWMIMAQPRRSKWFFSLASIGMIFAFFKLGFLNRFKPLLQMDFFSKRDWFLSTSGRSDEFIGIVANLGTNPFKWLFGSGMGTGYVIQNSWEPSLPAGLAHYAHFSPFTYLFIFGLPFATLVYLVLGTLLWVNRTKTHKAMYLIFLTQFVTGFFGANLMIDPFFWFVVGVNIRLAFPNLKGTMFLKMVDLSFFVQKTGKIVETRGRSVENKGNNFNLR